MPDTEDGPEPIAGYTLAQAVPTLPQVDSTAGAKQRYYVSVPNVQTRMLLGSRIPSPGTDQPGVGYDGFNAVTHGHLFFSATQQTATLSAQQRVYLVSMTDSLAAIAMGDVLVGSQTKTATVAAHKNVMLIGGYGPSTTPVTVFGVTPASPLKPDCEKVVSDHQQAALISTGIVGVISNALGIIGTKRALKVGNVVGYVLMTAGLLSGFKAIAEGSSKAQLFTGFDPDDGLPSGVGIHGKSHVTVTAGLGGSISMFAHSGSITGVAGITAGIVGGIAGNVSGGLTASVTGLATAGMNSIMSSNIVSVLEASIEARKGVALVRGASIKVGDLNPPAPQLPTLSIESAAIATHKMTAGRVGGPQVMLNGVTQQAEVSAMKKVTIDVTPFSVEVTPLGVHVKYGGESVVEVTPMKIVLKQLAQEVEVSLSGVKMASGGTSVQVTPAAAKVAGPKVLLG
ncbi:MAG: hypothetical protein IT379_03905 [Deltaproteobacteria bacterium]|nr:hypothetical protein [Deltaproteobacteria bacterium]